jgi:hypothetical protein
MTPSAPTGPYGSSHRYFPTLRPVRHNEIAEVLTGADRDGVPVTVVVLREHAADARLRAAFAEVVNRNSYSAAGQVPVHAADVTGARPWAAGYPQPGWQGLERILTELPGGPLVDLAAGCGAAAHPAPVARSGLPAGAKVVLVLTGVLAVLVAVTGVTLVGRSLARQEGMLTAPAPVETAAPPTAVPASPSTSTDGQIEPTLRPATPVTVLGPSYAEGEPTYTMAFRGWPFAFRTPVSWGCLGGRVDIPDSRVWMCIDERDPQARQRMNILLRPCPTVCTSAERAEMNQAWLDEPERAKRVGERTYYVETARDDRGLYSVDASHFFADPSGGGRHWQVGVYVAAPEATRDVVLKVFNDVVTQAG